MELKSFIKVGHRLHFSGARLKIVQVLKHTFYIARMKKKEVEINRYRWINKITDDINGDE